MADCSKINLFVLAVSLCLGLSQCGSGSGVSASRSNSIQSYASSLAKWQNAGIADYDYTFQKTCFCLAGATESVRISVRESEIRSVATVSEGSELEADVFSSFYTVEELFELIRQAIDSQAVRLEVSYDEVLGYPTFIDIDFDFAVADDEITIEAGELARFSRGG